MLARRSLITAAALAVSGSIALHSRGDVPTTAPVATTSPMVPTPPPTPSLGLPATSQAVPMPPPTPVLPQLAPTTDPSAVKPPAPIRKTAASAPATGPAESNQLARGQNVAPSSPDKVVISSYFDQNRIQIAPSLGANTTTIGPNQIDATPGGDNANFQQTLLRAPGVVEDNDGQVHVRGEHANLTYRVNGILLPDPINAFGQAIDTRLVQSVTLIDGTLPAQFGFRTAGIVDVITKSGDSLNSNEISIYGGGNQTFEPSIQLGGTTGNLDYFVVADGLHNDLGIENTTPGAQAIHDDTNQQHFFTYLSDQIDNTSRISLIANFSNADFQIPNTAGLPAVYPLAGHPNAAFANSAGLDENQNEQQYYGIVSYLKSTDRFSMQLSAFTQYGAIHFTPDPVNDLIFQGIAGEVHNNYFTNGVQFDSSYVLNDQHTIRAGFLGDFTSERLDTNSNVFATSPVTGTPVSDAPVYIADNSGNHGASVGLYLQDEWHINKKLTLNYGARYDRFDTNFADNGQLSPRVNLVYKLNTKTTLHAGYARYFVPPPLQYVGPGTLAKFSNTTNAAGTLETGALKVERSNTFDVGVGRDVTKAWKVNLDAFYKDAHNLVDNGQFGSAVIITPFNYRLGQVYGSELSSTYTQGPWSLFGNFAYVSALGKDIISNQYLIDPGELAYIHNHYIPLDHEGNYTGSLGFAYRTKNDLFYVDALYGSGLRRGFANLQKEPEYFPINLGWEHTFFINNSERNKVKLRVDVLNVFNESYQIRDGSGIGVAAASYGARRSFLAGVAYDF